MAKQKKTLDDAALRAMASMASSSSDLSKLQENFGWNADESVPTEKTTDQPLEAGVPVAEEKRAPAVQTPAPVATADAGTEEMGTPADETPQKSVKASPEAAAAKRVNKYASAFLEPISGFERPTKVAYISKRTHSFISLLQRYASLTGSKVSMQEIMENIFRQHFTDNKTEIEAIRATLLQKETELHG